MTVLIPKVKQGNLMVPSPDVQSVIKERAKGAAETYRIQSILNANAKKNFVQRILKPTDYPAMELEPGDKGTWGTHMMSYSSTEQNGAPVYPIYPEIVQDPQTGKLRRLGRREAFDYAMKTGEYIPFDTAEEAEWFGSNYKKIWKQSQQELLDQQIKKGLLQRRKP